MELDENEEKEEKEENIEEMQEIDDIINMLKEDEDGITTVKNYEIMNNETQNPLASSF